MPGPPRSRSPLDQRRHRPRRRSHVLRRLQPRAPAKWSVASGCPIRRLSPLPLQSVRTPRAERTTPTPVASSTGCSSEPPDGASERARPVRSFLPHAVSNLALWKAPRRRPVGCVYRPGQVFWLKWTDALGRTRSRSSGSADREVAENALRDELKRKADGLAASPDPHRTLVDDLLTALENRYRRL